MRRLSHSQTRKKTCRSACLFGRHLLLILQTSSRCAASLPESSGKGGFMHGRSQVWCIHIVCHRIIERSEQASPPDKERPGGYPPEGVEYTPPRENPGNPRWMSNTSTLGTQLGSPGCWGKSSAEEEDTMETKGNQGYI